MKIFQLWFFEFILRFSLCFEEILYENIRIRTKTPKESRCQIQYQNESLEPKFQVVSLVYLQNELPFAENLKYGGIFEPRNCRPLQKVAIIAPYRNRPEHLKIFTRNLHKMLIKQNLVHYQLFIIEQYDNNEFNRGKLFNIGFAIQQDSSNKFDCYIFHDVGLIPIDYNNLYLCSTQPRHMSYNIVSFQNFYEELFGGVCAIISEQFQDINGFSNNFWGWGGEDDEIRSRFIRKYYKIDRLPFNISRYIKLPKNTMEMLQNRPNPKRHELIRNSPFTSKIDGLNTLQGTYQLISFTSMPFYTLIRVDLFGKNSKMLQNFKK